MCSIMCVLRVHLLALEVIYIAVSYCITRLCALVYTLSVFLTHTHTHTHARTRTHTHTHTHTLTHTLTHTHSQVCRGCQCSLGSSPIWCSWSMTGISWNLSLTLWDMELQFFSLATTFSLDRFVWYYNIILQVCIII